MKFKKVEIESFAGLKNFNMTFQEEINLFYGVNGTGKTSLWLFLRSMLYGIKEERRKGTLGIRERILPLGESSAKGRLIIEVNGRDLAISRVFGQSKRQDQLSMHYLDDGEKLLIGRQPGEEFLAMNEETFLRTSFVSQPSFPRDQTPKELTNKLMNLSLSGSENSGYHQALRSLDSMTREIVKARGGGKLDEAKRSLENIQCQLDEVREVDVTLRALEEHSNALKNSQRKLLSEKSSLQQKKQELLEERLNKAREVRDEAMLNRNLLEKKAQELMHLSSSDAEFLESQLSKLILSQEKWAARKEELDHFVLKKVRFQTEVSKIEQSRESKTSKGASRDAISGKGYSSQKGALGKSWIIGLFSILLIALSLWFFYKKDGTMGGVCLLLGLGGVILTKVLKDRSQRNQNNPMPFQEPSTPVRNQNLLNEEQLAMVQADFFQQEEEIKASLEQLEQDKMQRLKEVSHFLASHFPKEDSECHRAGEGPLLDFEEVIFKGEKLLDEHWQRQKILEELQKEKEQQLKEPYLGQSFAEDRVLHRLEEELLKKEEELERIALESLRVNLKRDQLRESTQDVVLLQNKRKKTQEEIQSLSHKLAVIELAKNTLMESFNEISRDFLPKVTEKVSQIFQELSKETSPRILLKQDFSMVVDLGGAYERMEYLSRGNGDLLWLSLRFALYDIINPDHHAPLVFDDSFIRLDEPHLGAVLQYLEERMKGQVLIMTCHHREGDLLSRSLMRE